MGNAVQQDTSREHFNVDMWLPVRAALEFKTTRPNMGQNVAANSFLKWVTGGGYGLHWNV